MKEWIKKNGFKLLIPLIFYLIFQGLYSFGKEEGQLYSWMFLYVGILLFSHILPQWKILKPILILIQIPMLLLRLIHPFIQSFLMFMIMYMFSFGIITILFIHFPEYPLNLDLNLATKLYIILVSGSMILLLWGYKAIPYFNSIINNNRTLERERTQLDFTLSIVNKNKIKIIIYIGFLLYLIPYSVTFLSNKHLFHVPNLDKSIFNAFITYTAFERVLTNIDLMKVDWKSFFEKLFNAWK